MKNIRLFPWVLLIVVFGIFAVGCGGTTEKATTTTTTSTTSITPTFSLSSDAFTSGSPIPVKYANTGVTNGQNVSIPLNWTNVPAGTQSFALSMIDTTTTPDFVHWLVLNIPSSSTSLAENASGTFSLPTKEYTNDFPSMGYGGPQPPVADGPHSYVITIFALNTASVSFTDNLSGNNLASFTSAISGNILGQASITGTFDR